MENATQTILSQKENTMIKNSYFDGNVKSLGFQQAWRVNDRRCDGSWRYTFATDAPEKMTVIKRSLTIKRTKRSTLIAFHSGECFDVDGHSSFDLQVSQTTACLCEFL
ncbi:pyrimidine/purine nucleoside phosphorylase [Vibrio metschnikovii]